jgi:hypothetical protein
MAEKFLPIGVQDFEVMRQGNFVYVDKTEYIYQLVRPPQAFYFLSRPRRFGKSLMVSTLNYLFEGRKELFEGLWIYEKANWQWQKHPVVMIDFNRINHDSPENLKKSILIKLKQIAEHNQIKLDLPFVPDFFATLITKLAEKYGQQVVVLVDEYDKPLISHLGKGKKEIAIAEKNRDVLKQFFGVLKGQDVSGALRMVFITGVSKFSRVSIFSDLNNLRDLSMESEYGAILGYTESELEKYFFHNIKQLSQELQIDYSECKMQLQTWYNGYCFTEKLEKMYNPFSILSVLEKQKFRNYWFETGTPSFLVNLIKEKDYPIPTIEKLTLPEETFTVYDLEMLELEPLLFQTGYITINDFDGIMYELGYPNQEVKVSFLSYLYRQISLVKDTSLKNAYKLIPVHLKNGDVEAFIQLVNEILAAIPYNLIANQAENYYHSLFYLMLSAAGVQVHTEMLTSQGRIDIVLEFPDKVYIIELKCNQSAARAIEQIKEKKYADKYRPSGREIYLVGINFDTSVREITDWKMEKYAPHKK